MNANKAPDLMEDILETAEGSVPISLLPTIVEPKEEYKNDDLEKLAPSKLPVESIPITSDFTIKTYSSQ